jgi:hypothetical protein
MKEKSEVRRWWTQTLKEVVTTPLIFMLCAAAIAIALWPLGRDTIIIVAAIVALAAGVFVYEIGKNVNKALNQSRADYNLVSEISMQRVCEIANLHQTIEDLVTTLAGNVILPIWQTHGEEFVLAPARARDLRRRLGVEILAAVQLLPMKTKEVAALFGDEPRLIEDTIARATNSGKLTSDSELRSGLILLIAELRLAQAAAKEPKTTT